PFPCIKTACWYLDTKPQYPQTQKTEQTKTLFSFLTPLLGIISHKDTEAQRVKVGPGFSRICPCGAGSGAAKKLEESASTAPAGLLPCNKAIVNFIALRVYHVFRAGRFYCTPI
ncbi:MAG: hypothetical protein LBI06_06345, partial [Treponema sp.]|nr:hypothetical protein [Treponema sp.]